MVNAKSLSFKNRIRLITLGIPLSLSYNLPISKQEFRKFIIPKIKGDELGNPLKAGQAPFEGQIKGIERDEFELKICSDKQQRKSHIFWFRFYIKTKEEVENQLSLEVEFHSRKLLRLEFWMILLVFIFLELCLAFEMNKSGQNENALIFHFGLLGFFGIFMGVFLSPIPRQIDFFEKELIAPFL